MELHIVRHSPTNVIQGTCYGQSNVELKSDYQKDWIELKSKLGNDFDAVYTSPLDRCLLFAQIYNHLPIITDARLMEMNFGDWELKKWDEIYRQDQTNWMNDFVHVKTPNGENFVDLFTRVEEFYQEIKTQNHQKVIIVTHAGPIRCFWALVLEISLNNTFKIPIGFGEHLIIDTEFGIITQKS